MTRAGLAALAAVVALGVTAPAALGQPSREEALRSLAQPNDPEARRQGVVALGQVGTMADVPELARALRDTDPLVRALAQVAMWQVWSRSGEEAVDQLFALGVEQMQAGQHAAAAETFGRVIARRPDFAEAWNKRATVRFLLGQYEASLADCDEVLRRNPYHFGALSGYGMIYLELDRPDRALAYFEQALAVNPNLQGIAETVERLRALLRERRRNTL